MHALPRAALALALTTAATATPPPKPGNPPKLQKTLERAAEAMTPYGSGPAVRTGATVGDHLLTVNFKPGPGVPAELALKNMRETSWDRGICANTVTLQLIHSEGVTVRIAFVAAGQPPVTVTDVNARSCAAEASIEPRLTRIIDGVAFGPRPTQDEALAAVRGYVADNFRDPDSAQIRCAEIGKAGWMKPPIGKRHYGYFMNCSINAKNGFGGYVGATPFLFRINGDEIEAIDFEPSKAELMEPSE